MGKKKKQKKVNEAIAAMNENIYNDHLWLGRFYVHQVDRDYYKYEDGSGGLLTVVLEFVDKKTNKRKIGNFEYFKRFFAWDLFKAMNDFIVEDCDVWSEKPSPRENIIDYRDKEVEDHAE